MEYRTLFDLQKERAAESVGTTQVRRELALNALRLMFVTDSGMERVSRALQKEKAHSPISVSPDGRVTLLSFSQFWNTPFFRAVTPSGITTEVRPVLAKASEPMSVTLSGIAREERAVQPENA